MKSENINIDALRCAPASFVEAPAPDNEVQVVLRRALEAMGPSGERWHQNRHRWIIGDCMCVGGAVRVAVGLKTESKILSGNRTHDQDTLLRKAEDALAEATPGGALHRLQRQPDDNVRRHTGAV